MHAGKVTVNSKPLETRRQLESVAGPFFSIAEAHEVTLQLPNSSDEVNVPVSSTSSSSQGIADTVNGQIQLGSSAALGGVTHVRLSVSLQGVRMRVAGGTHFISSSRRFPKLRCRVYSGSTQPTSLLEVVAPLEMCVDEADCRDGIFYGASGQKLVPVVAGDQLSLRCVASPPDDEFKGTREVLLDLVQVDVSSV